MRTLTLVATVLLLAAALWIASPSETALQAQGGDGCTEILVNGDMESYTGWSFPSSPAQGSYSTAQYHSPTRSARLGIIDGNNVFSFSSVRQKVIVPAGNALILEWYMYPLSVPHDAEDLQYVNILNSKLREQRRLWSGVRNDQDWLACSFDVSEFLDQTIYVNMTVRNDGNGGRTALFVDDVSLKVCPARRNTLEGCLLVTP
ncbi:MAG: hypothetical protein D6775_14520, partial [Caldilineae bacterium]